MGLDITESFTVEACDSGYLISQTTILEDGHIKTLTFAFTDFCGVIDKLKQVYEGTPNA